MANGDYGLRYLESNPLESKVALFFSLTSVKIKCETVDIMILMLYICIYKIDKTNYYETQNC